MHTVHPVNRRVITGEGASLGPPLCPGRVAPAALCPPPPSGHVLPPHGAVTSGASVRPSSLVRVPESPRGPGPSGSENSLWELVPGIFPATHTLFSPCPVWPGGSVGCHLSPRRKGGGFSSRWGTGLGWGLGPQLGARERQPTDAFLCHCCFSLPSLPPFPPV